MKNDLSIMNNYSCLKPKNKGIYWIQINISPHCNKMFLVVFFIALVLMSCLCCMTGMCRTCSHILSPLVGSLNPAMKQPRVHKLSGFWLRVTRYRPIASTISHNSSYKSTAVFVCSNVLRLLLRSLTDSPLINHMGNRTTWQKTWPTYKNALLLIH